MLICEECSVSKIPKTAAFDTFSVIKFPRMLLCEECSLRKGP
jgi:hypothetical protein